MKAKIEEKERFCLPKRLVERYDLNEDTDLYLIPLADGFIAYRPRLDIKKVYIEPTTRCNLNCITCVRNVWDEETADMKMDTFNVILHQLRGLRSIRAAVLGGFGEPFSHPHILDMIRDIKALGLEVTISTNGTLIGDFAEAIVGLKVDKLVVSADGVRPEVFEDIRRGASLEGVIENLIKLNEVKRRVRSTSPMIGLEFVAMRRNMEEIRFLSRLARSVGASQVLISNLLPHTEEMCEEILYDGKEELPKGVGWSLSGGGWLEWGAIRKPKMRWGAQRNCRFVEGKSIVIGYDGGVSPCYALMHSYPYYIFGRRKRVRRYVLGNVLKEDLKSIWLSEEYVRFRIKVEMFDFPSCVDCGLACDLAEGNEDCWGNDPSCADCLWAHDIIRCP